MLRTSKEFRKNGYHFRLRTLDDGKAEVECRGLIETFNSEGHAMCWIYYMARALR